MANGANTFIQFITTMVYNVLSQWTIQSKQDAIPFSRIDIYNVWWPGLTTEMDEGGQPFISTPST